MDCVPANYLSTTATENYGSPDTLFEDSRLQGSDGQTKRAFTYFVLGSARFLYASAARVAIIKTIATMSASADVLALANLEVDLSAIEEGNTITVKWRGKPVFIKHRTDSQIAEVAETNVASFRHPETDAQRVQDPKWCGFLSFFSIIFSFSCLLPLFRLVVMGICTHLGCVPIANAGEYKGWYCPCHGSHYDGSGRIRKGPAPLNLEVPPYKFTEDNRLILG